MIEINQLSVAKGDRAICQVEQLKVSSGERVAVHGGNGSGKTTLLRVLAGLERDYSGKCEVAASLAQRVFVHQSPYMFRGTVLANVIYGLRGTAQQKTDLAMRWIEQIGIGEFAQSSASRLSAGERRRVALARAFVREPRLLLLDEPFSDMDEEGILAVQRAIDELSEVTVLVASPTQVPALFGMREVAVTSSRCSR